MKVIRFAVAFVIAGASLAGATSSAPRHAFAAAAVSSSVGQLSRSGTATLSGMVTSTGGVTSGAIQEIGPAPTSDRQVPRAGTSSARIPSTGVPTPGGNLVNTINTGFAGFNGLSHRDQRQAGTGSFANTQFSLEPPDQALCVGNGFVLESINTALQVFTTAGATVVSPTALNQFLGLKPEIVRGSTPVYGDFSSDPKCYYDAPTGRWFLTVLQADVVPSTGAFTGRTSVKIAVSQTGDPPGAWNLFSLDTTDDGTNGTPSHTGCPCLGDQPLIGADANGFYISTNEFPVFSAGFNGAQIYAISKQSLESGSTLPAVVHLNTGALTTPDTGGIWYSVQPATAPGGVYETSNGGTEYFLSALDFTGTLDNRVAVWALTNTDSLKSKTPRVTLTNAVLTSEVYGQPPDAQQRPGSTPLADSLAQPANGQSQHLELLAGNDDRMNQVVFAAGQLWSGVNTVIKTPNGPTRVGIAYFAVTPSSAGGQVGGTMAAQGYVAVNQENVMYPSIGVNTAGKGVLSFTLVGPDYYPSTGYAAIDTVHGAGDVHIGGAGASPEDGFTGYAAYGGNGASRWGDYSAAVTDADGSLWMAAEYIPSGPRTSLANWGTFVSHVTP